MQLLDTDILVDIQRGHAPASAWFAGLTELPSVSGFTVMELIQDAPSAAHIQKTLRLVAPLSIVWPTEADCAGPWPISRPTICRTGWGFWTL